MAGPGYGAGAWGGVPWGGAKQVLSEEECDLFLFDDAAEGGGMLSILSSPIITTEGHPNQFVLDYLGNEDLGMLSGDLLAPVPIPNPNALITAEPAAGIDDVYTVEISANLEALPNDFTDIVNKHVMFGVTDRTGPCAAFFLSKVGVAYAGAVRHVGGQLVLDSTFQQIPGTAPLVPEGEDMTYRVAVSASLGVVYLFATKTADLPAIGHQLAAILPVIDAADLAVQPPADRAYISVRGTVASPSRIALDRWCLSSQFLTPNIAPIANAGVDQAVRACSIALLDGSASFDAEGSPLLYFWRLIDAPTESEFADEGVDGNTSPTAPFDGFASRFHSVQLGDLDALDPIIDGDVLLVDGVVHVISAKGVDGTFYVDITERILPDNLSGAPFRLLRQRGISDPTAEKPTFFPDAPGLYKFDLVVFDGALTSLPSVVILNALESALPKGCTPDARFIFDSLSDFWRLVEDVDRIETFWSGLAQITATELYTLWQYEYAKSHRDIQRTVVRRWLHYDALLPEPLPELTRIRSLRSGVTTSAIPAAGDPAIPGTVLVLTSPIFDSAKTINIGVAETADNLKQELDRRLAEVDSRFTTVVVTERSPGTDQYVRINAPFPFAVSSTTTTPVFTAGDTNGMLQGTGAAISVRSYLVDRSLAGLDISEDDLLVVDGVGYRISRVSDGPDPSPDTLPFQRVVLKDPLPVPAGTNWSIPSLLTSELLDFYSGMVSDRDHAFLEVDTQEDLVEVSVVGASEGLPGTVALNLAALDAVYAEGQVSRLARVLRRTYIPVSGLLDDLPILQDSIVVEDEEAVLRRNVDFFLEEFRNGKAIRFLSGNSPDVFEGELPPERLWAEYSYIDNRPEIEANFGIPAGLTVDQLEAVNAEIDYLSAVRGLWYSFFNGPKPEILRIGAQIFLGLPFAEQEGTIEELRTDFSPTRGRFLIRDTKRPEIVRSYSFPGPLEIEVNPVTGERYVVGDTVSQFAPLVEGVEIQDYLSDPTWFEGPLKQGAFYEVQKYHTYGMRVSSEVFSLSAVLLVRDFVLTLKPTYTFPLILIQLEVGPDDVDVIDDISYKVRLLINDAPCTHGSPLFDDPNTSGGGWVNQFDTDDDPLNPPPTYPTSEPGSWAFDVGYLCPSDRITAQCLVEYDGIETVKLDTCLKLDEPVKSAIETVDAGPIVVPSPPGFITLTPSAGSAVVLPDPNTVVEISLQIEGGPGPEPTDYELVLYNVTAASELASIPFDATPQTLILDTVVSLAVTAGDTLELRIRAASAGPPRSPGWSSIIGLVSIEDSIWFLGQVLPAGVYTSELLLT